MCFGDSKTLIWYQNGVVQILSSELAHITWFKLSQIQGVRHWKGSFFIWGSEFGLLKFKPSKGFWGWSKRIEILLNNTVDIVDVEVAEGCLVIVGVSCVQVVELELLSGEEANLSRKKGQERK